MTQKKTNKATTKKPPLTEEKARWAKNRDVVLRGTRLNYNASLQLWYNRELRKLVKRMVKETRRELILLFGRFEMKPKSTIDE